MCLVTRKLTESMISLAREAGYSAVVVERYSPEASLTPAIDWCAMLWLHKAARRPIFALLLAKHQLFAQSFPWRYSRRHPSLHMSQ